MLPPLTALAAAISVLVILSDLYARRVPNTWLLAGLFIGSSLIVTTWVRQQGGPPWPALLGLLIGLAAFLPIHLLGVMGAGDVKFFSLLGFLLGAKALLPIWIVASIFSGTNALAILISRHWLGNSTSNLSMAQTWISASSIGQRLCDARDGRKGLPYAAWLGVGALITIFNPELMHW